MKVGDLVRRVEVFDLQYFIFMRDFRPDDVGVIVSIPENMGSVVDVMVGKKVVRYWTDALEVITISGGAHGMV
jgi:hypothetical protein